MEWDRSPFPCQWWGTSIDDVAERPRVGTYGRYKFAALPPLPFEMRGGFEWLADAAPHNSHIGREKPAENQSSLKALRESATRLGVTLPESFLTFMGTPALQAKIRSTTDCFLDLCPALVRSPIGDGWLARFLADSQGCIFWYLFMIADGTDHAVVSSPGFYGTAGETWQEEEPDPNEIVFSEESFESFLCRFWLENEICFSKYNGTPMPAAGRTYLDRYRQRS
jgi:hypothetical protein